MSLQLSAQDSLVINTLPVSTSDTTAANAAHAPKIKKAPFVYDKIIEKPTVGLGIGMFSFFGDVNTRNAQSPVVSRVAYELYLTQRMTESVLLNFNVLYGQLGANERFVNGVRNINFESTIRAASVNFMYDFGRFLPLDRKLSPYLSLGIESFEFLSKTDLYDNNNNRYFYWSDGTIRNIDEQANNASSAVLLHRDYTYESDVRESNLAKFGKYAERSFAIPVGIGFQLALNDFINFKMSTTMHFSFTDYIDGIAPSKGSAKASNFFQNDFFTMSSCGISYNFGYKAKVVDPIIEQIPTDSINYFALDTEDRDKDGVTDMNDHCQGTPPGVAVDSLGCPLDTDLDGIPNFRDDEINSRSNAIVDTKGVEITSDMAGKQYDGYRQAISFVDTTKMKPLYGVPTTENIEYTIDLGTFTNGLPAELLTKFLSIYDIESININDLTSQYIAGSFANINDAKKRKSQLVAMGLTDIKIVIKTGPTTFVDLPTGAQLPSMAGMPASAKTPDLLTLPTGDLKQNPATVSGELLQPNTTSTYSTNPAVPSSQDLAQNTEAKESGFISEPNIIFRVQLGAYSRSLSKSIFYGVNDLVEIYTDDKLYKYATTAYTTFEEVAARKAAMIVAGYEDAFITAYQNGKRISIKQVGATIIPSNKVINELPDNARVSAIGKKAITFKIQVGLYQNLPPADQQALFDKITNVSKEETISGFMRYTTGSFANYEEAERVRAELAKTYALDDAFVLALFYDEYISVQEALELLK
jgi:Domain of unknown function (DUF6089)